MLVGAIDPLEGSLVIMPRGGMVMLGAFLGKSRHRRLLLFVFILLTVGVGALWGISALGGFGGNTGRSMWWALVLLPYPVGWVMCLAGAVLRLVESPQALGIGGAAGPATGGHGTGAEADNAKPRRLGE